MECQWDLNVDWYQNEKNIITELGHSDRLKINVNPSKKYCNPGICDVLVMSMMVSFCAVLFPTRCLG